ncbi:MAG TPA: hypothetical protein VE620_12510 [Myxococcales bacterium]|nr:hypothetical protein [Myxococcales bacterium]
MRAAATLLLATALASAARAAPPAELFDPLKSIEYDLYDFAPEDQALWEASRYSAHGVRVDLGSVTLKELFAVQEAQANLQAASWLGFHLDVQDDGTREAEVSRFAADVLFRVAPGVEVGVSGAPDVVKQDTALGGAILLTSRDRTRYAVVRVLDDAALFNLQNPSGAHRDSTALRAQTEARWESGAWSSWLRADLGTPLEVRYPAAPPQGLQGASEQRSDLDAHLRWAEGRTAAGIRFTGRRLDFARTQAVQESALRRGFGYGRAYLLFPLTSQVQLRAVALGWGERARGRDADGPYEFSRWDFGGRAGAVWAPGEEWRLEAGYVRVHSAQDLTVPAPSLPPGPTTVNLSPVRTHFDEWGDKAYGSVRWQPRDRVILRFLLSHEVSTGRFGGFNGGLEVIF